MHFTGKLSFSTFVFILLSACTAGTQKGSGPGPHGYDLSHPAIIKLPSGLAEISGLSYYPKDTSVFAIEDEDGLLFKIPLNNRANILKWRYDKKHDFEDIVLHDSTFYALVSNGDIKTIHFTSKDSLITTSSAFPDASKKHNEFETLYFDDSLDHLIMLCKSCEDDDHKIVTGFTVDPIQASYTPGPVMIDALAVAQQFGMKKIKLKPSAAAINPITKELFILCSVNKLMVITDRLGKFRSAYTLDPALYKQPEGLAFTPWGDMIISNEAHDKAALADILIVKYKKTGL